MDTKTAQRQLVSLISQHLSDSIPVTRILTYKPSKNGAVTGRFESLGRVFNFVFNGQSVRYKPAMNADSTLFSEYYLERFDAAPVTPRGTRALPKCTSKSYSCKGAKGVACIPLTNNCRMANTAIGNERLDKIKGLSRFLTENGEDNSKVETARAKIVEQRMALAVENRAKRQPKDLNVPVMKTTKTVKAKKSKAVKSLLPQKQKDNASPESGIKDKIKAGKPILSNEVPDPDRLGSARLLNYLPPAKTQEEANDIVKDAVARFNKELLTDNVIDYTALKKATEKVVTASQLSNAIRDVLESRISDSKDGQYISVRSKDLTTSSRYTKPVEQSAIKENDFQKKIESVLKVSQEKYGTNIIPIGILRQEVGNLTSREDFSKWMFNMIKEDKFTPIGDTFSSEYMSGNKIGKGYEEALKNESGIKSRIGSISRFVKV